MAIWTIKVYFDAHQWKVSPDPAIVGVGDAVMWNFQSNELNYSSVNWSVYFSHGSPFAGQTDNASITTTFAGGHGGTTGVLVTSKPGKYKYGVRAEDASTKGEISKDDPHLIVEA